MSSFSEILTAVIAGLPIEAITQALMRQRIIFLHSALRALPDVDPEIFLRELLAEPAIVQSINSQAPGRGIFVDNQRKLTVNPNFICARAFEWRFPDIRLALADLRRATQWQGLVDMRVYASGVRGGLDAHTDPRHAVIIQLAGEKLWEIFCPDDQCRNTLSSSHGHEYFLGMMKGGISKSESNLKSFTLKKGDLLFLPAHCLHATASDGISLACNVAFNNGAPQSM